MNNLYKTKSKKTGEWVYGQYLFATQHHGKAISKHWIVENISQNGGHLCCGAKHAIDETTLCRKMDYVLENGGCLYENDKINCTIFEAEYLLEIQSIDGNIVWNGSLSSYIVSTSMGLFCLHRCSNIKLIGNIYNTEEEKK